jgi:hypothetical protein
VQVGWAAINELLNELGDIGTGSPLGRQVADLLFGWDLAGEEEPEETFWEGFVATGGFGEDLLAFWNLELLAESM